MYHYGLVMGVLILVGFCTTFVQAGEVAPVVVPQQELALSWYNILISMVYGLIGILLLIIGYYIYEMITPFSVKKELLEDQNIALGIVIAAFILGMAIIIAAAIL